MAIIPRYTSRALPEGAQPGLVNGALARGRAGARLAAAAGDGALAGVAYKRRKDAEAEAQAAARLADRIAAEKRRNQDLDHQNSVVEEARAEAALTQMRAARQATPVGADGPAKGWAARALADYDRAAGEYAQRFKDRPQTRARIQAIAESGRAAMSQRLISAENRGIATDVRDGLANALDGLVAAAATDPAMAPGAAGRGLSQIAAAMKAGTLLPEEAAAMQGDFGDRVHMAAMRGQIETDPAGTLARLQAGEFDDVFDGPARDRLIQEAGVAARADAADRAAKARARQRELHLAVGDYLTALGENGRGDAALEGRVRAELPPADYAAFEADQAAARERFATRREYAFMTPQQMAEDIAAKAPGGGPRGTDARAAGDEIRRQVRDEILAARAADPAGWAMRDESVAQAFAAAADKPDDPALARKATGLSLALQREMGVDRPRLLTAAERDGIAEQLAQASPGERVARITALREQYGTQYGGVAGELSDRTTPDTGVLLAHVDEPLLAGALARGMAMDGVEFKGARELTLPMVDGKLDKSRLEDGQLYSFMAGDRVVRAVYDRKTDALVPTSSQSAADEAARERRPNLPDPSRPEDTSVDVARKFVENTPAMFKKTAGGLLQAIAERAGPDLNTVRHPLKPGQSYDDWRQERIDIWRAEKGSGPLSKFGADLAARASADLQANAPNVDPESLKGYAYDISSALVQAAPAVAASVVTKSPSVGMVVVGAQVYGDRYAESRAAGRTEAQAHTDATFYALTEAIPERIPLGILMKPGQKFLPRVTQTMAAEGVQEMFTEVLQTGYDAGILDEQMTWAEAWDRIKRAGIVGTVVGGGTTTFAHPFVNKEPGAETAPEDVGNAPSGTAGTGNVKSGGDNYQPATIRTLLRPLVEQLASDKWRARFDLAEFADRAKYPLPGLTAKQYFGDVWTRLPAAMQTFLDERYRNFAGQANENIQHGILEAAGFDPHEPDAKHKFDVPIVGGGKGPAKTVTRIPDQLVSGELKRVLSTLFVVPGKANGQTALELKLQSSEHGSGQRNKDEALVKDPNNNVLAVQVLRMPADRIKPEHLADVIDKWLERPKRRNKAQLGKYRREDIVELVRVLREQRGPDGKPLSIGVVLAVALSFALPLAYPDATDADERDSAIGERGK